MGYTWECAISQSGPVGREKGDGRYNSRLPKSWATSMWHKAPSGLELLDRGANGSMKLTRQVSSHAKYSFLTAKEGILRPLLLLLCTNKPALLSFSHLSPASCPMLLRQWWAVGPSSGDGADRIERAVQI